MLSVIQPPSSGPTMVATPKTLMSTPAHRALWAGGKMSPRMAWVMGSMAPAPSPWRARNPMSSTIERLCPHSAEPTTNSTIPTMKKRLRPYASESLPQMGMETADASR